MSAQHAQHSIVHVLAPARFGGLETVVQVLAGGLRDADVPVTVVPILSPDDKYGHPVVEALEADGIDVIPTAIDGRDYSGERRAVRAILKDRSATVLHTHGYRPDVMDSGVAKRLGIPRVTTVHGFTGGGIRNRTYEWMQKRAFRRFDSVIAVSEKLRAELVDSGIDAGRVKLVRNAWRPSRPVAGREEARSTLGLPNGDPVVGWVGRLTHEKGPDVFVRSAAQVRNRSARFSMIGSGPMEKACRSLANSEGLNGQMHWHGSVEGAGSLLRAFDVLVLSSWTEGTPMLLLEAMTAGVPIVTTAVGGIPDVVSAEEAVLCPAGDIISLASAVDRVLSDDDFARDLGNAAQARVAQDNAVEAWIEHHLNIYDAVAGAPC